MKQDMNTGSIQRILKFQQDIGRQELEPLNGIIKWVIG